MEGAWLAFRGPVARRLLVKIQNRTGEGENRRRSSRRDRGGVEAFRMTRIPPRAVATALKRYGISIVASCVPCELCVCVSCLLIAESPVDLCKWLSLIESRPRSSGTFGSWKLPSRIVIMNNVIDFINTNRDRYVDELKTTWPSPASARCRSMRRTCRRVRGVDGGRDAAHRDAERAADRHAGHPRRLRRLARAPKGRRRSSSTATTTCSRSIRSSCGSRRRSKPPCATARSTRAARPTTRGRCSCTSRRSRRT